MNIKQVIITTKTNSLFKYFGLEYFVKRNIIPLRYVTFSYVTLRRYVMKHEQGV